MAVKPKSKAKAPPRQHLTDAEIKQALKFAKARGLTKVDLRKPLTRYRKELALKYSEASKSPALYTTVKMTDAKARKAFKKKGFEGSGNKILVKKQASYETVRATKDGNISITNKYYPEFNKVLKPGLSKLRDLKPGEKYRIHMGGSTMTFSTYELLDDFLEGTDSDSDYGAEIVSAAV